MSLPTSEGHASSRGSARSWWWLHALVLWLAFALRTSTLASQGLWRDEVDQLRFAFQPLKELVANFTRPGWNGPLYSPMLRAWVELAGGSAFAMRFLSVIWAVPTVSLVVVLARRLTGDRWVARVSGALIALSPYLIWYAQEVKMYTWVPMLAVLALVALDRACRQPRLIWFGVVLVATSLAVYSHILAALLVPVLVVWFVIHPARGARAWGGGLMVLAGLTLPYLPLLAWQAPLLTVTRQTGYPDFTLVEMATTLLNGWSVGISQGPWGTPTFTWAAMAAAGVLAGTGALALIVRAGWGRRWRAALRLATWAVLPLLGVWLVSQRGSIFTDRYLIWSAPAFYILMATGLVALCRLWRPLGAVVAAGLVLVSGHGWDAQATAPVKPDFASAVSAVEAQREDGDVLLFQIPYNHHVFAYYADRQGIGLGDWVEAPYTNWREADGSYRVGTDYVARELRRLLMGYQRVWLIYSEAAQWDDRELVLAWMDEEHVEVSRYSFHGVEVVLYARDREVGVAACGASLAAWHTSPVSVPSSHK